MIRQRGFTLLEVLVAFLMASLLLSVLLSGFSTGMAGLMRSEKLSLAAWVAQSRLAELGILIPLETGVYEGQDTQNPDFRWRVEVQPLDWGYASELQDSGGSLQRVDVVVRWPGALRDHQFVLTTLRLHTEDPGP